MNFDGKWPFKQSSVSWATVHHLSMAKGKLLGSGDDYLKTMRLQEQRERAGQRSIDSRYDHMLSLIASISGNSKDDIIDDNSDDRRFEVVQSFLDDSGVRKLMFTLSGNCGGDDGEKLKVSVFDGGIISGICCLFVKDTEVGELPQNFANSCLIFLSSSAEPMYFFSSGHALFNLYLRCLKDRVSCALDTPQQNSSSRWLDKLFYEMENVAEHFKLAHCSYKAATVLKATPAVEVSQPAKECVFCREEMAERTPKKRAENAVSSWIEQLQQVLTECDYLREEPEDMDLRSEMKYWKCLENKLHFIIQQTEQEEVTNTLNLIKELHLVKKIWPRIISSIRERHLEATECTSFLETLEKYCQPLYSSNPAHISQKMPELLSVLLIMNKTSLEHRSTDRLTVILSKVTNLMIRSCRRYITCDGTSSIWGQSVEDINKKLAACISLQEEFKLCFAKIKELFCDPNEGTPFKFCEVMVFGKFEAFCQRLKKLLQIMDLMEKYSRVMNRVANGCEKFKDPFQKWVSNIKTRSYDFLDHKDVRFDEDFAAFASLTNDIQEHIVQFVDSQLKKISSTKLALKLLSEMVYLPLPREQIEGKFYSALKKYAVEIRFLENLFRKNKDNPSVLDRFPPYAGRINWCRHIRARMEEPIKTFEDSSDVLKCRLGEKIIKKLRQVLKKLSAYEKNTYQEWLEKVEKTAFCLMERIFYWDTETSKLQLNSNQVLFTLIREADLMSKMNFPLPFLAEAVLYKSSCYKRRLITAKNCLKRHVELKDAIKPELQSLADVHLRSLEQWLKPSVVTITWANLNVETFLEEYRRLVEELEMLIKRANGIIVQLVETTLKTAKRIEIFNLPEEPVRDQKSFLKDIEKTAQDAGEDLESKNNSIFESLQEVIRIMGSAIDSNGQAVEDIVADSSRLQEIYRKRFADSVYIAVVGSLEKLLNAASIWVQPATGEEIDQRRRKRARPMFFSEVSLVEGSIAMKPTVEELQQTLNQLAEIICLSTKKISVWQIKDNTPGPDSRSVFLFDDSDNLVARAKSLPKLNLSYAVMENREIAELMLKIGNCFKPVREAVEQYLKGLSSYEDLWLPEIDEEVDNMKSTNPSYLDFEDKIKIYCNKKREISSRPDELQIGCLLLNFKSLKEDIMALADKWCAAYGKACREKNLVKLEECSRIVRSFQGRLTVRYDDVESIKAVISVLEDIRDREVDIDQCIQEAEDCFSTLNLYPVTRNKQDVEAVEELAYLWMKVRKNAADAQDNLLDVKNQFKEQLKRNISDFEKRFDEFLKDYEENSPRLKSMSPSEVNTRLVDFQNHLDALNQMHATYVDGAILFGYKVKEFPVLMAIKRELGLMHKLHRLYNDVMDRVQGYRDNLWAKVDVDKMSSELIEFQNRCRKLPKGLKEWPAFSALKKTIDDFTEMCPLLELMTNKAMKTRHWKKIQELTKYTFDVDSPNFSLKSILESPILEFKEEVEDICISAVKEKDIEGKLRHVTSEWSNQNLTFSHFKNRGELLLRGDSTAEVISLLEDSLMVLGSLQSNRYNAPFKNQIQKWIQDLSNTNEILERWLFTQNMWVYLEAVFMGGDIAKQLPKEAKRFSATDKSWVKVMARAHEKPNVVECCVGDDTLKQLLPYLQEQLDICQKSLSGYLEKKRLMFPRFFFVSDPTLLEILGQASDSHAIQAHLMSIFDNTKSLVFDDTDYNKILAVVSSEGETIKMNRPVKAEGNAESWLMSLLKMSQKSLHAIIRQAVAKTSRQDFSLMRILRYELAQVGQLILQMTWTSEAESAIRYANQDKKIMAETNSLFLELLNTLIEETGKHLEQVERRKFETFITIHVHQRDIFNELFQVKVGGLSEFEWQRQFRFYFDDSADETVIRITDVKFAYQNEFLGCTERLVITPLTDRCYITLAQALAMNMGGSPTGPAGTGKTETTKDMGKTLGKYVVVFNCSDQMDYRGLGRIFKGLAQSGAWGCFDEFNRIDLPVLSVAAQQIAILLACKRDRKESFVFSDGDTVRMNPEFGIFLTMNPGYAGRQELPENLKIQFRTVAMMVPDRQIIIRVKLASCGFLENITLARKFYTLYALCEEQLSKQVHYDFGLRNILSVLRSLGAAKRQSPSHTESTVVTRVLRDTNLSKLVDEDEPLFLSLVADLFPDVRDAARTNTELDKVLAKQLSQCGLINHPPWTDKARQLYDVQLVRHGIMVLGPSGSGKTTCIRQTMEALTSLGKPHKEMRVNPKAILVHQMFGRLDAATNDWTDGVFSALWRKTLKAKEGEHTWIVLDGPVDSLWIENLNSVLDDNKTLTLANGDRLPMSPNCKVVFEVHSIENASPATVSRNGMVYMSASGLSWEPILRAWLIKYTGDTAVKLENLFKYSFGGTLAWCMGNVVFKTKITEYILISQMLMLLNGLLPEDSKNCSSFHLGKCYVFSLIWSFGACLEEHDRKKLEQYITLNYPELEIPRCENTTESIFGYKVGDDGLWMPWESLVPEFVCPTITAVDYNSILVPNVDNFRMEFLIDTLARQGKPVLLIGEAGTGKTVTVSSYVSKYDTEFHTWKSISFSSATAPVHFQRAMESYVEKRAGSTYGPAAGKKMTVFIDDINMPEINEWNDQVTNELVRQTIEIGGFYSLEKPGIFVKLVDIQYVAAMGHPGGGRNELPDRLKRHFAIFNCTRPSDASMDRIFGSICQKVFAESNGCSKEVEDLASKMVPLTRMIWSKVKVAKLPTPAKFHYMFNLRDLSRIWQGMLTGLPSVTTSQDNLIRLWKHECSRVISDRFTCAEDKEWFENVVLETVQDVVGEEYSQWVRKPCYFVDFLRDTPESSNEEEEVDTEMPKVYEPVTSVDALQERLSILLTMYNEVTRGTDLDIVFFEDAISHLTRISRILRTPSGHALLVGVGGSGKQSLTKLASYISGHSTFQVSLTRNYSVSNFLEDLKVLFKSTGIQDKGTTFIFTEQSLRDEAFLQHLNSILACGTVPNLFNKEELSDIIAELAPIMKRDLPKRPPTPENVLNYFYARTRKNLHVVLCFSPVGQTLRKRALKFPGIISGCTIDWFQPWPEEALVSVSRHFLRNFPLNCCEETKEQVVEIMGRIHSLVAGKCNDYFHQFRRSAHVTPKSFLSFLGGYKSVYNSKTSELGGMRSRMEDGIAKLEEAANSVEGMKISLARMEKELEAANRTAEQVLKEVSVSAEAAESVRDVVQKAKCRAQEIVDEIHAEKVIAEQKLEAARPALEEAEAALNTIQPTHIATVRKLGRPPTLIMYIMDCVLILFQKRLSPIQRDPVKKFVKPSWDESLKFMSTTGFLQALQSFPKDTINDEVVELLEPYFNLKDYNMQTAKRVCGDVAGLLSWTTAMSFFFGINKEVLPLKANLAVLENRLEGAMEELNKVEQELEKKEAELQDIKTQYHQAIATKEKLLEESAICNSKMCRATTLISELSEEYSRWTEESKVLKDKTLRLVGDAVVATAFLSYAGPFNQEYRMGMIRKWQDEVRRRQIPSSSISEEDIIQLLVDQSTVSEWNVKGLPSDVLSTQNGILVTSSLRYPFLVDPQQQGKTWIKKMEESNDLQVTTLNHKLFRQHLEDSLTFGRPLLIEDVGQELDPVLDNILDKNFTKTGSTLKVMVGEKECDVMPNFRIYITTKLPNPTLSPEVSAMTLVIDFTVTVKGLEEQLLSRVMLAERQELENQRVSVMEEIADSKKSIRNLEDDLLKRLTSTQGSLVDNEELITVLQNTKSTAYKVAVKLCAAAETQRKITAAREEFRPVAARGSILYFLMVEMSSINIMYQTSLAQFLGLFDLSVEKSEHDCDTTKRIQNISEYLTYEVYRYQVRGCYERHKFLFVLMLALRLDLEKGKINYEQFLTFVRGGSGLDMSNLEPKPFVWIPDISWMNIYQLSALSQFKNIISEVKENEKVWKRWFDSDSPEAFQPPGSFGENLDEFGLLLLVRSCCTERTIYQAKKYVSASLERRYVDCPMLDLEELWRESNHKTPLLCLLSASGDPSSLVSSLAKKRGTDYKFISMGQGQEVHARRILEEGMNHGEWIMLQNCHLSLDFCQEILDRLTSPLAKASDNFRLWITTEQHERFPIGLLQIALRFTSEPPHGIKPSLKRTFSSFPEDVLEHCASPQWRRMLYAVSFLNTVLQERKKFGPLGWNVPYDFDQADLAASLKFLQKHLDDVESKKGICWGTVRFMLNEVHYGGRVTDEYDKRLLTAYCDEWFTDKLLCRDFSFHSQYRIPDYSTPEQYMNYIESLPDTDSPEVFGLHSNAEITYQMEYAKTMLQSVVRIPPTVHREEDPESVVYRMASEMLEKLPEEFDSTQVRQHLSEMGSLEPMTIFLKQEIGRLTAVLNTVKETLMDLRKAICGTISMSEHLSEALDALFRSETPLQWRKVSWKSATVGFWVTELQERDKQLKSWCLRGRPVSFSMSGFFNPLGFLTCMRQEVMRKNSGWSLDSVSQRNDVTSMFLPSEVTKPPQDGVYVHGLYLEGASWDTKCGTLAEPLPKILYQPMPIIHVYAINSTSGKSPDVYECPVYRKPKRTDVSYITSMDLKTACDSNRWVLRSVALLTDVK